MGSDNNEYIIYCAGTFGERALLILEGMSRKNHVVCFGDCNYLTKPNLWGREVYSIDTCMEKYPGRKIIIANSVLVSAYIIADSLEKKGLIKEKDYDIVQEMEARGELDYTYIVRGIRRNLKDVQPILVGEQILADQFISWTEEKRITKPVYCDNSAREIEAIKQSFDRTIWIVLNHTHLYTALEEGIEISKKSREAGIDNYAFFFLFDFLFSFAKEKDKIPDKINTFSITKAVCVLASGWSGQWFVNSLFDGHPQILFLENTYWGADIYYIVKKLSKSQNVTDDFKQIFTKYNDWWGENWDAEKSNRYFEILDKYFKQNERYSEKDILVGINVAYYEMIHGKQPEGDLCLYIDSHDKGNDFFWPMVEWLKGEIKVEVFLLHMIRRPIIRVGSMLHLHRTVFATGMLRKNEVLSIIFHAFGLKSGYGNKLLGVRFEDVKLAPERTLKKIVEEIGINWNESLLTSTMGGQEYTYGLNTQYKVTGFDIKPVYNMYDEYFSAFDRFRLEYCYSRKNKAYDYPYEEENSVPRELIEISNLYAMPWRVEKYIDFKNEDERIDFRNKMQLMFRHFDELKKDEQYGCFFEYIDYVKADDSGKQDNSVKELSLKIKKMHEDVKQKCQEKE